MKGINSSTKQRQSSKLLRSRLYCLQQKGMILVLVLIFLLAMSLLSVSSISSAKLQLTLLNNQQTYLQAMNRLANAQQLVFSQLTSDVYSEKILNLERTSNRDFISSDCDIPLGSSWLPIDLTSTLNLSDLTPLLAIDQIKTYLSMLSIELIDNDADSLEINLSSKRVETLIVKQCLSLTNSDLGLLQTSMITRRGSNSFSISTLYHNTEIKLAGN